MPTYDYICAQCDHEFEVFQRMSEESLKECPECHQPALKRKIGLGAGIIFKGGGFYETDFKDKKSGKNGSGQQSQESSGSKENSVAASDSGKGDSSSASAGKEANSSAGKESK